MMDWMQETYEEYMELMEEAAMEQALEWMEQMEEGWWPLPPQFGGPRVGARDRSAGVIYGLLFFNSIWRMLYNTCGSQKPAAYITPVIGYLAIFVLVMTNKLLFYYNYYNYIFIIIMIT